MCYRDAKSPSTAQASTPSHGSSARTGKLSTLRPSKSTLPNLRTSPTLPWCTHRAERRTPRALACRPRRRKPESRGTRPWPPARATRLGEQLKLLYNCINKAFQSLIASLSPRWLEAHLSHARLAGVSTARVCDDRHSAGPIVPLVKQVQSLSSDHASIVKCAWTRECARLVGTPSD